MAYIDPRYLEHQRKRFLRHDWERYMRHDWERYMRPDWRDPKYWEGGAPPAHLVELADRNARGRKAAPPLEDPEEIDAIERERLAIRRELASLRLELALLRFKYNPNQPRVPAGSPEGGRWTDGDGHASTRQLIDISAARRAKGHHFVPQSIYRDLPLRPETRDVFDQATTGPLRAERHGWSQAHDFYNQAVNEHLDRFLERNNIRPEQLTPDQVRSFLQELRQSTDPRVRDFNLRIFRQEFQYWLRRGPRGRE